MTDSAQASLNGSQDRALEFFHQATTELASAWRGDWSDFDGRTLRSQIEGIQGFAQGLAEGEGKAQTVEEALRVFRLNVGLCSEGHGYWSEGLEGKCFACG